MQIAGSHNHPLRSLHPGQIERPQSAAMNVPAASQGASDSVELSESARLIQQVLQEIDASAPTSPQRLAELREQVQQGLYQPPVEQLAAILAKELF
ncbi:MAG: flagellar biosynthesis anti-sigma factor FlgM [Caldilineae bacterium]|nr:MAG: flagellar biosynthesis anti-sigma factor FlgM [Caldilineae bacterium]